MNVNHPNQKRTARHSRPARLKTFHLQPHPAQASVLSVSSVISVLILQPSEYPMRSMTKPTARENRPGPHAISTLQPAPIQKPRPFPQFPSQPQKPSAISTFAERNFHRASPPQPENLKSFNPHAFCL
jgi:hypothetical protein